MKNSRRAGLIDYISQDFPEMVCDVLEEYNRQQTTRVFSITGRQPSYNSSASRIGVSAAAAQQQQQHDVEELQMLLCCYISNDVTLGTS